MFDQHPFSSPIPQCHFQSFNHAVKLFYLSPNIFHFSKNIFSSEKYLARACSFTDGLHEVEVGSA